MSEENVQVLLKARPVGLPKASDFEVVRGSIPEPGDGEVLVKNLYLSLDPAMRGWMMDRKSYVPPIGIGEVMRGLTAGVVVSSNDPAWKPGQRVVGILGWQCYATAKGKALSAVPEGVPLTLAMGPLGMTGMTAFFGLFDVGQPKAGETVLVSAAAGAVGSLVGQLAKIEGCRAVGIAGGEDKCNWITSELGFDAAIDYKGKGPDEVHAAIAETCPQGVDVYFDNVGGMILDQALRSINRGARVVICGAISQYNATEPVPGPTNYLALLVQRARMEGFIVMDYAARYGEAQAALGRYIQEGRLKARQDVVDGLENAPRALLKLFDGSNTGKLLVRIAPEG